MVHYFLDIQYCDLERFWFGIGILLDKAYEPGPGHTNRKNKKLIEWNEETNREKNVQREIEPKERMINWRKKERHM